MRATIELSDNIKAFDMIDLVDDVYADTVPPEDLDGQIKTTMLITESLNQPSTYGSNTFVELSQTLKISIYYGERFEQDTQIFEISLYKFLEKIGWRVHNVQPTYFDDATNQAVRVFDVTRLARVDI